MAEYNVAGRPSQAYVIVSPSSIPGLVPHMLTIQITLHILRTRQRDDKEDARIERNQGDPPQPSISTSTAANRPDDPGAHVDSADGSLPQVDRSPQPLSPAVLRYLQDDQTHERLACGYIPSQPSDSSTRFYLDRALGNLDRAPEWRPWLGAYQLGGKEEENVRVSWEQEAGLSREGALPRNHSQHEAV